jgi:HD superfamily phosphohydrolase
VISQSVINQSSADTSERQMTPVGLEKGIRLHDPVYGPVVLDEPLLIDLYRSVAVQRLGSIYQGGITAFINPARRTTRLDHSVGVMALLYKMGAGLPEQAAGLVHDVPHTAFSHVVDFLFPNREHTFHEAHREFVMAASDLPEILGRHGLDWRIVSDADRFSLLEEPLPDLCADRLDYFLRDGLALGLVSSTETTQLLAHLHVWEGQIVVEEIDVARWLGDRFMAIDDAVWCSVQEIGWYVAMARALGAAIEAGVLTESDLWGTDEAVLQRLRAAQLPEIQRWLDLLCPDVHFVRDDVHPDLVTLPKVRAVDPSVLADGHVQPLSRLDADFDRRKADYVARKQGQWGLGIEYPA